MSLELYIALAIAISSLGVSLLFYGLQSLREHSRMMQRVDSSNATEPSGIFWISVEERVPDDRRRVLVWCSKTWHPLLPNEWMVTRFNRSARGRSSGMFDCESRMPFPIRVTHWADVDPPAEVRLQPPPKKP